MAIKDTTLHWLLKVAAEAQHVADSLETEHGEFMLESFIECTLRPAALYLFGEDDEKEEPVLDDLERERDMQEQLL